MIIATAALAALAATTPTYDTDLADAVDACIGEYGFLDELDEHDFTVLDGGHSVVMSSHRGGAGFDAYRCVAAELGLPEWPGEMMGITMPHHGLVDIEVDWYRLMWSWHPDARALVVLTDGEA